MNEQTHLRERWVGILETLEMPESVAKRRYILLLTKWKTNITAITPESAMDRFWLADTFDSMIDAETYVHSHRQDFFPGMASIVDTKKNVVYRADNLPQRKMVWELFK